MQSITNAAGVEKHFSTRSILRCLQYTVLPPEVTDSFTRGPLKLLIEQSSGNCKHCRMIHALRGESTITQRQTARLPHFELADLDHSLCLSVYRHNATFLGITGGSGSDCASRSGGFSKRERSGCSARLLIVVLHVSAPPLCLIIDSSRGRLSDSETRRKLYLNCSVTLRRRSAGVRTFGASSYRPESHAKWQL